MNILRRLTVALLPLAIPLLTTGSAPAYAGPIPQVSSEPSHNPSPLIDKVRFATQRFRDINVAISEGFVQGTPCVSGPNSGAMGVQFVLPARIGGGVRSRCPSP